MESITSAALALDAWIRQIAGEVHIERALPTQRADAPTVHVVLLGIEGPLDPNDARRGHRRFVLQHLLLADDAEPARAADLVARLLVAGVDHPELDAKGTSAADPLWAVLGIPPRPAIRLGVPWRVARAVPGAPPVRQPLAVGFTRIASLEGTVVGPDGLGIANARVRVSGSGRPVTTDARGRFRIDGVARIGDTVRLDVAARGTTARIDAPLGDEDHPLRIEVDPTATTDA